ncbi:hypothetical protein AO1008_02329 [Aspergillus oryzae 100-8]|uniref:Uncharacterized protein n=1 Tax=Aspergillus oryzae (strain 3.042) TaxID=1160506 RepID=I8TPI2_ASPO3|nr:hypothetical protein Ao3042_08001 [Aspergillus oryzae 3.042]KDE76331.1 hypothetical protein AO1008_02329 [Aspergillus oryzae 100-8]|eukprot:EIT76130.1 hypothetical protein Ao3042_08001 [Aspergillus oryzae 3.042]
MLVYFEPAAMCSLRTDLVIAPLPAKKQLWEAGDELLWKAESQRESGFQTVYGLAASGDLVQLGKDQLYSTNEVLLHKTVTARGSANWEEWCSGMDGLGGLGSPLPTVERNSDGKVYIEEEEQGRTF